MKSTYSAKTSTKQYLPPSRAACITQVETSTRGTTAAKGRAQFARGTFGAGAQISKRAFAIASELITA